MHRSRLTALMFVLAAACGGGQVASPPETPPPHVTSVEIFQADDWRAEVARLDEPNTALIRFFGNDTELEGIPLVYKYESTDYGKRWFTRVHGRERSVLYGIRSGASGEAPWRLHAPNARDGRPAKQLEEVPPGLGEEIAARYARLLDEGKIDALQRFDRAHEIEREEEGLTSSLESARRACGHESLAARIDWSLVDDETILSQSIYSRCDGILSALRTICDREGGAEWVRENVSAVECHLTDEVEPSVRHADRTLTFVFAIKSVNVDQKAREGLLAAPDATHGTLEQRIVVASTTVCADEAGEHFIVLSPRADDENKLAYGTREGLSRVTTPWGLSDGWFQDARFFNEKHNDSFRGHDLRFYSFVEAKDDGCRLVCGSREVPLARVDDATKAEVLAAPRNPSPFDRVPHALARDKAGTYYYVDRGNTDATARDFQLFRGRRGAMRRLDMKDVVSDSEGEVFESRTGILRLIVDRDEALWIRGKAKDELKALPIGENLGLIFNELGVYLGRELGTPCDDL
jgi:hypothetical protein